MRYVALLRGLNNAGMARRVAMVDLRALFESLGFRDVRTVLNSGNVVFSVATKGRGDVLARIEKALASRLQLTAPGTGLSAYEVASGGPQQPALSGRDQSFASACPRASAPVGPPAATAASHGTVVAGSSCTWNSCRVPLVCTWRREESDLGCSQPRT